MLHPFDISVTGITTTAHAQNTAVELTAPHSGVISRIVVTQTDGGTAGGYTLDLYNKREYAGSTVGDLGYGVDYDAGTADIVGKIMPTITVASSSTSGESFDVAYPYRNRDVVAGNIQNISVLHAVINPTSNNQVFSIAIAGVAANG